MTPNLNEAYYYDYLTNAVINGEYPLYPMNDLGILTPSTDILKGHAPRHAVEILSETIDSDGTFFKCSINEIPWVVCVPEARSTEEREAFEAFDLKDLLEVLRLPDDERILWQGRKANFCISLPFPILLVTTR